MRSFALLAEQPSAHVPFLSSRSSHTTPRHVPTKNENVSVRCGASPLSRPFAHQLFVTTATAVGVYFAMDDQIRSDLNSLAGPTIMTAVLAYYTGKMITSVYGMAITTILQCFVADEELFPPSQQFAENDLRGWVEKHGAPMEAANSPRQSRVAANQYSFS